MKTRLSVCKKKNKTQKRKKIAELKRNHLRCFRDDVLMMKEQPESRSRMDVRAFEKLLGDSGGVCTCVHLCVFISVCLCVSTCSLITVQRMWGSLSFSPPCEKTTCSL